MRCDHTMKPGVETTAEGDRGLLPEGAGRARLIVCERTGRWAVALRLAFERPAVRVYQTRSVPECWEMFGKCPASFVVAELTTANADALLDRMARHQRLFPLGRVAVVAKRSMAAYEPLLREAGAVHFLCSPRQVGRLAQLACRHLAQVPPLQQNLTERIWANLPWGARGEGRGTRDEKR